MLLPQKQGTGVHRIGSLTMRVHMQLYLVLVGFRIFSVFVQLGFSLYYLALRPW